MFRDTSSLPPGPPAPDGATVQARAFGAQRSGARLAALSCALLAAIYWPSPAGAQGEPKANVSPPAESYAVSPGGVDMRTGRYAYSETDLAIGGEGGALALTRTLSQPVLGHDNPFGNFSHNWDILICEKRINVDQPLPPHGRPARLPDRDPLRRPLADLPSQGPNSGFEQTSRSGFALADRRGQQVLVAPRSTPSATGDGTVAVFRPIGSARLLGDAALRLCRAGHRADGTRLSFDYDNAGGNATRLRTVTSCRGYALLLEYSGNLVVKACVLNLALTTKPGNNVCPSGVPTATYAYGTVGGQTRLATATDPDERDLELRHTEPARSASSGPARPRRG